MSTVRRLVQADGAPAPVGPYSHAVVVGETVYCSGQLGIDPSTNAFAGPDVAAQTDRALQNLSEVLSAAGSSMSDVAKATVFLVDMGDF
ncbi:MAG: Rid family hydrolase, partial [Thermoplasmata archaeon]|nr:Rid family hydrolase [Thermoplasmata archaeon]